MADGGGTIMSVLSEGGYMQDCALGEMKEKEESRM